MAVTLRQKAARGVLIVTVLKVIGTIVGRVAQLVLPLYLLPTDFGIFALAVVFSGVLALLGELGMSTELIRRKERFAAAANTAFTVRFVLAGGLIALSLALGWVAATVYAEPRLGLPVVVLSLGLLFQSVAMVPRIMATRDLDFRRAAVPDNVGKYGTGFLSIALAILGFAYWAPVYGALVGVAVGAGLQLAFTRWRPTFEYDPALAREVVRFGRFVTLGAFATFVSHSVDNVIVGLLLGVAPVGYYVVAYSWGVYFTSNLTSVLTSVSYPVLSQIAESKDRLRFALSENLRYYGYAGIGLSAGVVVLAPIFVTAFYGPTWVPAIVPMQLLAPVGLLLGYGLLTADALYAVGRARTVFLVQALEMGILLVLFPPATFFLGLAGTSLAALAGAAALAVGMSRAVSDSTGLTGRDWVATSWRPFAAAAVAAAVGLVLDPYLTQTLTGLAIALAVYLAAYLVLLHVLTRGRLFPEAAELLRLALRSPKGPRGKR